MNLSKVTNTIAIIWKYIFHLRILLLELLKLLSAAQNIISAKLNRTSEW